jgi:hypothetical protein
MSSEPPGSTVEVKEEASAVPEDSIVAEAASPGAGTPTPASTGLSKELTETLNGVVRRLTDVRDKDEYSPPFAGS